MAGASILVVDDEPDIRQLVKDILEDEGFRVRTAADGEGARRLWAADQPDLVLLDVWMPDMDGISLLKEWQEAGAVTAPVIMISGHGTVETAVEATRLGAFDFIEKPLSLAKLLSTVRQALAAGQTAAEEARPRASRLSLEPVGHSAVMQNLRNQVRQVAQTRAHVLFRGEPGTGKGFLAQYLHNASGRRQGPWISVTAAWLESNDAVALLAGSTSGPEPAKGLLQQAHGGTLLIESIEDLGPAAQRWLAGALRARAVVRRGEAGEIAVDTRVVATSPRDLAGDAKGGTFHSDLYYALAEATFAVPPLRERREDVPEWLNHFASVLATEEELPYRGFSTAAQNRLRNYDWPGNIRELKNLVRRVLAQGGSEDVSLYEVEGLLQRAAARPNEADGLKNFLELPMREARDRFEKAYLEYHLQQAEGNVGKMARRVGMERTHLYRKLRGLGIEFKRERSR